jgi:hypothetical protein
MSVRRIVLAVILSCSSAWGTSSIVQQLNGTVASNGGTLSFGHSTTTGNAIVVVVISGGTFVPGNNAVTDDSGTNLYDFINNKFFSSQNSFSSNQNTIYAIPCQSAPGGSDTLKCAPMQTFTFNHWNAPPLQVWAFEIAYASSSDGGPPGVFWYGDNSPEFPPNNNATTTQKVPDTGRTAGDGGDVSPKKNLYIASIASFSGTVNAVADGLGLGTTWTLAPVQNGWGVATAEVVGSTGQQASFTNSTSVPFAGLWVVMADVGSAPVVVATRHKVQLF